MHARLLCSCVVLSVCLSTITAQVIFGPNFPFGPGGFRGMFGPNFPFGNGNFMGNFADNMNNMMQNIQGMGERINEESRRQAQAGNQYTENLKPGQRRYFNDGNRRGYAYKSPDGQSSFFSYSSGGPSTGFVYHSGPDGTYSRRW